MKNNILILFATLLLSIVITEAEAQNIDREVTIEKEYTPEVDAAVKKTGIPQAENPLVEKPFTGAHVIALKSISFLFLI